MKYRWEKFKAKAPLTIADWMPRWLAYACFQRVASVAFKYSGEDMIDLTILDAGYWWDDPEGGPE